MKIKLLCLLLMGVMACQAGDLTDVRAALIYQWAQLDWRSNAADYETFNGYLAKVANRHDASDLVRMQAALTRSLLHAWHDGIPAPPGMPDELAAAYTQLVADTTNAMTAPALVQLAVLRHLMTQAGDALARGRYLLATLYLIHARLYIAAFPRYYAVVDDQRAAIEWERLRSILQQRRTSGEYIISAPAPDFAASFPLQCLVQADANLTNGTIARIEKCWFVRSILAITPAGTFDAVACGKDHQTIDGGARVVSAALPKSLAEFGALLPEPHLLDAVTCSAEPLQWFQGDNTPMAAFYLQSCRAYLTNSVTVSWRPECNPVNGLSNITLQAVATVAQIEKFVNAYLSSNAWWLVPRP